MLLKVSLWKKVLRFGWKVKLSPRFIGPYEVIERIDLIAYWLNFLPEHEHIHDVFHVSKLQKYRSNSSHIVTKKEIKFLLYLTYEEELIEILALEEKVLRTKEFHWLKFYGETTKWKRLCGKLRTWWNTNIPICLVQVNFKDEIHFRGRDLSHPENHDIKSGVWVRYQKLG